MINIGHADFVIWSENSFKGGKNVFPNSTPLGGSKNISAKYSNFIPMFSLRRIRASVLGNRRTFKKSLAQEVRQKSDISEHRSKGWG